MYYTFLPTVNSIFLFLHLEYNISKNIILRKQLTKLPKIFWLLINCVDWLNYNNKKQFSKLFSNRKLYSETLLSIQFKPIYSYYVLKFCLLRLANTILHTKFVFAVEKILNSKKHNQIFKKRYRKNLPFKVKGNATLIYQTISRICLRHCCKR